MAFAFVNQARASAQWLEAPYKYVVLEQDVRQALTEFGRNLGLPVVLSDAISGRVHGRVQAATAGEFIELLSSVNGLTWYFDGSVLHFSANKEFSTRVFEVGTLGGEAVANAMRAFGLFDDRFSLRAAQNQKIITVSGPPAYIAVVERVVVNLQRDQATVSQRVRIFRGGVMEEVVVARSENADQTNSGVEEYVRAERVAHP